MKILITGSNGFIGRNLISHLKTRGDVTILTFDIENRPDELPGLLDQADVIFHLAGINRPKDASEFETGNAGLTHDICEQLIAIGRTPLIILSSSIQAELDNPYGISKRHAEEVLKAYAAKCAAHLPPPPFNIQNSSHSPLTTHHSPLTTHHSPLTTHHSPLTTHHSQLTTHHFASIYRLPNVFGKWCRPNYNSAVATFCHNIANDLPIQVSDPARELELVYIDDVVAALVKEAVEQPGVRTDGPSDRRTVGPTYRITLGRIVELLQAFKRSRFDLQVPNQADDFTKKLYATYLSYLPPDKFSYPLKMNVDAHGSFTEFLKTPERGQVSINISKPNITKGNHWHRTKNEKFLVVSGRGVIRFRKAGELGVVSSESGVWSGKQMRTSNIEQSTSNVERKLPPLNVERSTLNVRCSCCEAGVIEYRVSGEKLEVVDIPPGYTHNIENLGDTDMVTVMWASETFDPQKPDTVFEKVSGE